MAKRKAKSEAKDEAVVTIPWYKGYDIRRLRQEPEHPDFYLVEEYDKLDAKGGDK